MVSGMTIWEGSVERLTLTFKSDLSVVRELWLNGSGDLYFRAGNLMDVGRAAVLTESAVYVGLSDATFENAMLLIASPAGEVVSLHLNTYKGADF